LELELELEGVWFKSVVGWGHRHDSWGPCRLGLQVVRDAKCHEEVPLTDQASASPLDFTPACLGFGKELQRIASLMAYTSNLHAFLLDKDVRRLVAGELDEDDLEYLTPDLHTPFVIERMLCALAEALLWYLAALLNTVFTLHPYQMLARSKSTDMDGLRVGAAESAVVALRSVLEYETREQLLTSIIEEKVDRLSYKSLKSLDGYFREALKLPLTEDQTLLQSASRVVAMRNLLVHNRGLVNRRFRGLWGDDAPPLGQRLIVNHKLLNEAYEVVEKLVEDLEARAVRKYLRNLDEEGQKRLLGLFPDAD